MIEAQPTIDSAHRRPIVSLTDAAAVKLPELTKDETNPEIGLRVYVYSGGCSGYRYGMMLEDQPDVGGQRPRTPTASASTSTTTASRSSRAARSTTSTP